MHLNNTGKSYQVTQACQLAWCMFVGNTGKKNPLVGILTLYYYTGNSMYVSRGTINIVYTRGFGARYTAPQIEYYNMMFVKRYIVTSN